MEKKKCFKCNEIKLLRGFYKHKQMSDGHVNKCIECNKKDIKLRANIKFLPGNLNLAKLNPAIELIIIPIKTVAMHIKSVKIIVLKKCSLMNIYL